VLEAFGDRAARGTPDEDLLRQLAEALRRELRLESAEVWTRSGDALQRLVAVPSGPAATTMLPGDDLAALRRAGVAGEAWLRTWLPQLVPGREDAQVRLAAARYGGDLLGLVLVQRPRAGERFTPAEERRLGDLVGRLGLALHNRQLDSALQATLDDLRRTNEELRASRTRLVAAADAERRRIERDIHDGAQQHLVALAVNLGLARDMLADDATAAAEVLADMAGDLKETIAQLRALAHGIYPPLLREAGLGEALRAAAGRSPQPVEVVLGELARYGSDVESTVYFCCLEALANSAKHAAGATVRIELAETDGVLGFSVADDGPGYDARTTALGQGFQNMTDRLGAVGGTVSWTSSPGAGARVDGQVPVPVAAAPVPVA
jgi:signal transduction histidine kinase